LTSITDTTKKKNIDEAYKWSKNMAIMSGVIGGICFLIVVGIIVARVARSQSGGMGGMGV
jgi:hypothetical protein